LNSKIILRHRGLLRIIQLVPEGFYLIAILILNCGAGKLMFYEIWTT